MERKGSGFSKIINNYVNQINYHKSKKPYFRSDAYQFTVIMPNLNYGIEGRKLEKPKDETKEKILTLIRLNPNITTSAIAFRLELSRSTVSRKIKELKGDGIVARLGTYKEGVWEVVNKSQNDTINDTEDDTKDDTVNDTINEIENDELKKKIIYILKANPNITINAIAFRMGLSRSTVLRKINEMKEENIIEHVGSRKNGEWKINRKMTL